MGRCDGAPRRIPREKQARLTGQWFVVLSPEAELDLREIDNSTIDIVKAGLRKLSTSPELRGHALKGSLAGCRSLVVGKKKIRIVYSVIGERVMVYVVAIGRRHNDEVYLKAATRTDDSTEG